MRHGIDCTLNPRYSYPRHVNAVEAEFVFELIGLVFEIIAV